MNIILLGSGGREHAMAYKIVQSKRCNHLFIAPGNAGTMKIGTNIALDINNFEEIKQCVLDKRIKMVVVGPGAPLVAGIVDYFAGDPQLNKVIIIGPSKEGARLEGSKNHAKAFMASMGIPTARYATFGKGNIKRGEEFLNSLKAPYVLKADGLAAGKGVIIAETLEEAKKTLHEMVEEHKFGDASDKVVIEEYLQGIELSVFVLTDGQHYKILPSAKDYKRIGDGDTGLNTGGMGSVSPVVFADKTFMKKVEDRIVIPTIKGLKKNKIGYKGFIFIGLMAVQNEDPAQGLDPYVIEYNVRMGDPETESVFPRIKSDVVELFQHTFDMSLNKLDLEIDPRTAATVMMVAGGYPGSYEKGHIINGLDKAGDCLLFHAGTASVDGVAVTNGGRVLSVTALANSLPEALLTCYQTADKIDWKGKQMRRDIGQDLLKWHMPQ